MLKMLRETGLPLTTKDITLRVVTERGLNAADPRLMRTVHKPVSASLRHLWAKGLVQIVAWAEEQRAVGAGLEMPALTCRCSMMASS